TQFSSGCAEWRAGRWAAVRSGAGRSAHPGPLFRASAFAVAARASTAPASTTVVAARAVLARRPRRGVLRPLDQLLRRDEAPVLVLLHELQPDPSARLVDLLDDDVDDVAPLEHVLD